MRKRIAALRCRLRGHHAELVCSWMFHEEANLAEHIHSCPTCGALLLVQLKRLQTIPYVPPMGMAEVEQSRYLQ